MSLPWSPKCQQMTRHTGEGNSKLRLPEWTNPPHPVQWTGLTFISSILAALGPQNSLISQAPHYKDQHTSIPAPGLVPRDEERAGLVSTPPAGQALHSCKQLAPARLPRQHVWGLSVHQMRWIWQMASLEAVKGRLQRNTASLSQHK